MNLDTKAVEEFRQLYKQEFGTCLDNQQAAEYAQRLIQFVRAVYGDNLPRIGKSSLTTSNEKLNNKSCSRIARDF